MQSKDSPTILSLLFWANWLLWKSNGAKVTLCFLALCTVVGSVCGYVSFRERTSVIESQLELANWNRKLQLSAFSDVEDVQQILGYEPSDEERNRARVQRLIARLPTSVAYSGSNFPVVRFPSPMQILAIGSCPMWPDRFFITAHSQRQNLEREDIYNPYLYEYGFWDVSSVVIFLLPLVILILIFDGLTYEKANGLLPIIMSHPVDIRHWMLVNLIVRTINPLLVVLPAGLLPLLVSSPRHSPSFLLALCLSWMGLVVIYATFWAVVALTLTTIFQRSSRSGVALVSIWFLLVCFVPAAVARLANASQRVITKSEIITHERKSRETAEANGKELLEAYYAANPGVHRPTRQEDPYGQTRWDAIRLKVDEEAQPVIRKQLEQLHKREEFVIDSMVLSPAIAIKLAFDDLSGGSLGHHVQFIQKASEFDEAFKSFFQPRMMSREELTLEDYQLMPVFEHLDLSLQVQIKTLLVAVLVISGWIGIWLVIIWIKALSPSVQ